MQLVFRITALLDSKDPWIDNGCSNILHGHHSRRDKLTLKPTLAAKHTGKVQLIARMQLRLENRTFTDVNLHLAEGIWSKAFPIAPVIYIVLTVAMVTEESWCIKSIVPGFRTLYSYANKKWRLYNGLWETIAKLASRDQCVLCSFTLGDCVF